MEKTKLEKQLETTLSDASRFKKSLVYESSWHVLSQFVFWIAFIVFVFVIMQYIGLMLELILASSGALKLRLLGLLGHNIWLTLRYPLYLGWSGYFVIAGEVALAYGLIWSFWRMSRVNQLYQQYQADPSALHVWRATGINLTHNLIYTAEATDKPLDKVIASLSKAKQAEWEKLTHQVSGWRSPRTNYDKRGMQQFMKANLPATYQLVDVMLSEPYSQSFYWQKDNQEQWVAGMAHHGYHFYFLNKYQANGKRRRIPVGAKITNMIYVLLWH